MTAKSESGAIIGGVLNDILIGDDFSNTILGYDGKDRLQGYAGNDALSGGNGNDTIQGGLGSDLLRGGAGDDVLYGGFGRDRFRFDTALSSAATSNLDQVRDFSVSDDTILLEHSIFARFSQITGTVPASNFKVLNGVVSQDADDYLVFEQSTGALYYDPTGDSNGLTDAVRIGTITLVGANQEIANANFIVF